MGFKKINPLSAVSESPEKLFYDLAQRKIGNLHDVQADVLRDYHKLPSNCADVAIEMDTGAGKTLVGLLIAEWRRRLRKEPVVYLCPTKQLVNQVVEMATAKFGIKARAFLGSNQNYDPNGKNEYLAASTVAVCTYSALFNSRPFFSEPGTIVLDDAHACDAAIANVWTVQLDREKHGPAYNAAVGVFLDTLSAVDRERVTGNQKGGWDAGWVELIPSTTVAKREEKLIAALDSTIGERESSSYAWSAIRANLRGCQVFIDTREVLIRPLIPPTFVHKAFSSATQRIYMSATLGNSGDLERYTGRQKIHRIKVQQLENQGVGRRFFVFPHAKLSDEAAQHLAFNGLKSFGRGVVLVPDSKTADSVEGDLKSFGGIRVFRKAELENSKLEFVNSQSAAAVLANRYDGIDFPGDECRFSVVSGLPKATNLQEKFLATRLAAKDILTSRILTRCNQGFGRCIRSGTDYAAIVVLSEELHGYLADRRIRSYLPVHLQAELEFGLSQSRECDGEDGILENLTLFRNQSDEWTQAVEDVIKLRDLAKRSEIAGADQLRGVVEYEVQFQEAMWRQDYSSALAAAQSVIGGLKQDELRPYRAFWCYLAGVASYNDMVDGNAGRRPQVTDFFSRARKAAPGVGWLQRAMVDDDVEAEEGGQDALQIEEVEARWLKLGAVNTRRFDKLLADIETGLRSEDTSEFELAQKELGLILGFASERPKGEAVPDGWWKISPQSWIVFEDHSGSTAGTLDVGKARQAAGHEKWIQAHHNCGATEEVRAVLVTPVERVTPATLIQLEGVYCWPLGEFVEWATRAVATVRLVRNSLAGSGDMKWRDHAIAQFRLNKMTASGVLSCIRIASSVIQTS
jgi:hypothetical protein